MLVNKRTIIFITNYPFNEDYARKYGFDILKKRGFDIVILNVFNFIYPEAVDKLPKYSKLEPVWNIEQVCVKSIKELERQLNSIRGWKIVFLKTAARIKLLRVLKRARIDYIKTFANIGPYFSCRNTFSNRYIHSIIRLIKNPFDFFLQSIVPRMPYPLLGIKHPKHIVLGSNLPGFVNPSPKTKIIHTHSYDYDRYLRNINIHKPVFIPDEDYYVHLLNSPWALHDYVILNIKPSVNKDEYKKIINNFLDFLEEKTKKRILIAANPKATEDQNIYNGRPFIKNNTEQLVKYSSGVITHHTGAINFAVIHNKPICLISARKLDKNPFFHNCMHASSKALGLDINYIDTPEDWRHIEDKGIFHYNPESYADYTKKYITLNKSEKRLHWDIISDVLCDITPIK